MAPALPIEPPKFQFMHEHDQCDRAFSLDSQLLASLARRHVILLDTSVWIRLADCRETLASRVLDRLLQLKNAERVFCPLVPATIWELRKQSGESLLRTADLMETLSENVTFRSLDQIYDSELDSVLDYLR